MYTKIIAQLTWVLFSSVKIANSYFSVALVNQELHLIKMVSFVSVNIVLVYFSWKYWNLKFDHLEIFSGKAQRGHNSSHRRIILWSLCLLGATLEQVLPTATFVSSFLLASIPVRALITLYCNYLFTCLSFQLGWKVLEGRGSVWFIGAKTECLKCLSPSGGVTFLLIL